MHQKIYQHTEALERLKEMIDANENLSKKILKKFSDINKLENTETHGNIQMFRTNHRHTPNVRRKMTYGMMLRSVLLTNLSKACRECELEKAANATKTTKKPTTTTRRYRSEEVDFASYVERK